jgi:hypothetical protein
MLYDYFQGKPDERQYLKNKVQALVRESHDGPSAVSRIDAELWRYYLERSEVAPDFIAAARAQGTQRTSMKNLAEHLVRAWTEPRPRKTEPEDGFLDAT